MQTKPRKTHPIMGALIAGLLGATALTAAGMMPAALALAEAGAERVGHARAGEGYAETAEAFAALAAGPGAGSPLRWTIGGEMPAVRVPLPSGPGMDSVRTPGSTITCGASPW